MTESGPSLSRLTLKARVGLLAAVAVGLAVAATSVAAYVTARTGAYDTLDRSLLNRAEGAAESQLTRVTNIPPELLVATDVRVAVLYPDGSIRLNPAARPPVGSAELSVAQQRSSQSIRTVSLDGTNYRVAAVPLGDRPAALILAQPTQQTEEMLERLGLVLFIVGASGIAIAGWAGFVIARAGLRPVDRLTAAAEHVAATEELEPIEVRGNDELARLASSFNSMLLALRSSRDRQQQLVADAGHELRTPLTSLRTNLDLLAQSLRAGERGLPPADRDALLADVRAQIEELTWLVQDLVELGRDDRPASSATLLDFAEVCERAVDRVRRRAPRLTFDTQLSPWEVCGDATALERAVTNILDNAAKWSPPHGKVVVHLEDGVLQVRDEGPGIADEDLPYVFDRFYRSAEARGRPGSGLGLAIVKQVADRHGGAVSVARADGGGTIVTFRVPPAGT